MWEQSPTKRLGLWDVGCIDQQVCQWVVSQGIVVISRSLSPELYSQILLRHAIHLWIQGVVVLKDNTAA